MTLEINCSRPIWETIIDEIYHMQTGNVTAADNVQEGSLTYTIRPPRNPRSAPLAVVLLAFAGLPGIAHADSVKIMSYNV